MATGLAAGLVLFSYPDTPGPPVPDPPEAAEVLIPDRFSQWSPFVLSWGVTRPPDAAKVWESPLAAGFIRDPCGALDSPECYVQLAWQDLTRWSLTVSPDPDFGREDLMGFTAGPLHYGVVAGVMVGQVSSDRVPLLHICNKLLRAKQGGESVTATPVDLDPFPTPGLRLERPNGESASCMGPAGLPMDFSDGNQTWNAISWEGRAPTEAEIGIDLVYANAHLDDRGCQALTGDAFSASPAGIWLLDLIGPRAGYRAAPAGSGIVFLVASPAGPRTAIAWVTVDDPAAMPTGARQRKVGRQVVVDETLEPSLVQSTVVEGIRIWIMFDLDPDQPRTILEREAFVLGGVSNRVAELAGNRPFESHLPAGLGVVPTDPFSSPSIELGPPLEVSAGPIRLPDPKVWSPTSPLPNGLPVWETVDSGSRLVLAGGGSFEITGLQAGAWDGVAEDVASALDSALVCPWVGLPAQPR